MIKKAKKVKDIIEEDPLLKEISDDVKNDQMKVLWDKYGLYIIIFVAVALTAAVSFETFKNWANKRNQEISNTYAVALSLQSQGKLDESLKLFQNLAGRSGLYADIAKLQIANIYFEQNKPQEAVKMLEQLVDDAKSSQMQEIAALKLAAYKIDTNAPAEEVQEILLPLTQQENGSYNVARELLAMLAIRDGKLDEAKKEYEQIIASASSSDELKSRAQDMITIIDDQNK